MTVQVHSGGRHFQLADGSPHFLLADNAWGLAYRCTRAETDQYLEDRAARGFNTITFCAVPGPEMSTTGNGDLGHRPPVDRDGQAPFSGNWFASALVDGYWAEVDYIIDKAESLGMYVWMVVAWFKDHLGTDTTYDNLRDGNAQAFGELVGARYASRKDRIHFLMGGDHGNATLRGQNPVTVARNLIKGIAIGINGVEDYTGILASYHPDTSFIPSSSFGADAWFSYNSVQTGHWSGRSGKDAVESAYAANAGPALQSEVNYERHGDGPNFTSANGCQRIPEADVRRPLYQSLFAGSAGMVYGADAMWPFYKSGDTQPTISGCNRWSDFWHNLLALPVGLDMKHMHDLIWSRRRENGSAVHTFFDRAPDDTIITAGQDSGVNEKGAMRWGPKGTAKCVMVYFTPGGSASATVDMASLNGPNVEAWWFNPRDGAVYNNANQQITSPFESVAASGTRSYTRPTSSDWILVLDSSDTDFATPGQEPTGEGGGGGGGGSSGVRRTWRGGMSQRAWAALLAATTAGVIGGAIAFLPQPANPSHVNSIIETTYIACEGNDIGSAVNNALNADRRVVIGPGRCTSSTEWAHHDSDHLEGHGQGVTEVTFDNGSGAAPPAGQCALESPTADSAGSYLANLTMVMTGTNNDILCIHGISNTALVENIETRGGRDHIVLTPATSDDSSAWVGEIANWASIDAGSNGLSAGHGGNVRLQVLNPTIVGSGGPAIHLPSMNTNNSAVNILNADLRPDSGATQAVLVTGGANQPVSFLGGSSTLTGSQNFLTTDSSLAVAIIAHDVSCNLLVDRPGTDVSCAADRMVVPNGAGGDTVSVLSAADRAIWNKWEALLAQAANPTIPFWAYQNFENIPCSGNIGPAVQAALDADKAVFLGKGQCTSGQDWVLTQGDVILGRGIDVTEAGSGMGTYVIFDQSTTSCAIRGDGRDIHLKMFKPRTNADRDLFCFTGFTGRLEMLYPRAPNGDGVFVLSPDSNNVVADGGVIRQVLPFWYEDDGTVDLKGTGSSKARLAVVGCDCGRGGPAAMFEIAGLDPATSAVAFMGNHASMRNGSPNGQGQPTEVMNITGSGRLPVLLMGFQPWYSEPGKDIIRADSDVAVTSVGFRTGSFQGVCDQLIEKPGTADDVNCTTDVRTHIDLVDF